MKEIKQFPTLDELYASIKDYCLQSFHEGISNVEAAKELNKLGYRTPNGYKLSDKNVSQVRILNGCRNPNWVPKKQNMKATTNKNTDKKADKYTAVLDLLTSNISNSSKSIILKSMGITGL